MPSLTRDAGSGGRHPRGWVRGLAVRAVRLAVTLILLSMFYEWASPWAYPKDRKAGLGYGAMHGAMMPMALPALLLGRDVPIFAENHAGRWYKIGYIAGINLCGILVFGSAFLGKSRNGGSAQSSSEH